MKSGELKTVVIMSKELIKQVKDKLEEQHGYDFDSEFWTDDNIVMLQEIIEATEEVIIYDINGISKH